LCRSTFFLGFLAPTRRTSPRKAILTDKKQNQNTHPTGNTPSTLFLVFEFCSYDLYGLLTTREIQLTLTHLKSFAVQLLKALHFTHSKNILHRDLKTANILVTSKGVLKIADWGLAREWNGKGRLTLNVVTLWYRAPELILGANKYGKGVDVWSVGCILGEMFRNRGSLFSGHDETTQINAIFDLLGVPDENGWASVEPFSKKFKEFTMGRMERSPASKLQSFMKGQCSRNVTWVSDSLIDLMQRLLEMDPDKRITAGDAFIHEFFIESPRWVPPEKLNMDFRVESVHEYASRNRSNSTKAGTKK
jgi:serine/threonine protein kinase